MFVDNPPNLLKAKELIAQLITNITLLINIQSSLNFLLIMHATIIIAPKVATAYEHNETKVECVVNVINIKKLNTRYASV